ncbi:MAG: AAC(3) family N-acetyltransferase [Chlamydiales bacterium]|nr:AAC(3) family N-acetyltransferase [Chlamydiales bacterium]
MDNLVKNSKSFLKKYLPAPVTRWLKGIYKARKKKLRESQTPISKDEFIDLLTNKMGITKGDLLVVHSSMEELNLAFNALELLQILQEVVGEEGTLVFPTHIDIRAEDFYKSSEVFDVRKTLSYTGILSEIARRQKDAKRSLHPFNSVCAIGKEAHYLIKDHHKSILPCGPNTPYSRVIEKKGKVIGLGVSSEFLSLVHCIEDELTDKFPMQTREETLKSFDCLNSRGEEISVKAKIPHINIQNRNIPAFIKKHFPEDVARDFTISGRPFFYCSSYPFSKLAKELALEGKTIYSLI